MRRILHADFDAFYASVEQRENPKLKGRPVVVGGRPDQRGVVASASYEARSYGVRSAMPTSTALKMCPGAELIQPRISFYKEVSSKVLELFHEITSIVEPLSLDEAFLDITDVSTDVKSSLKIAYNLKQKVKSILGLTISVGVASNKSTAKIASSINKPDGFKILKPEDELEFLKPLPVNFLWGVGEKTEEKLHSLGVKTVGDLANQNEIWVRNYFGKNGAQLLLRARGKDDPPVSLIRETKSISSETTLLKDSDNLDEILVIAYDLSKDVARTMESKNFLGSVVRVKLRLSDFTTFSRQLTSKESIQSADDIYNICRILISKEFKPGLEFRLIGVGVSGFSGKNEIPKNQNLDSGQMNLLDL